MEWVVALKFNLILSSSQTLTGEESEREIMEIERVQVGFFKI